MLLPGHAILILSYADRLPHDVKKAVELHPGDVWHVVLALIYRVCPADLVILSGLQPGQSYALYHVTPTITTRGHFYLPNRFSNKHRAHSSASDPHPFQNPDLPGTLSILCRHFPAQVPDSSSPLFHPFMIAFGLLLTDDDPSSFESLGVGRFFSSA